MFRRFAPVALAACVLPLAACGGGSSTDAASATSSVEWSSSAPDMPSAPPTVDPTTAAPSTVVAPVTTVAVPPPPPQPAPVVTTPADPIAECRARPAMGDVLYRSKNPGLDWETELLGGQFAWDYRDNTCKDAVTDLISTTPTGPGYCGQVASAADNPNYDADVRPSAPLRKVMAAVGDC